MPGRLPTMQRPPKRICNVFSVAVGSSVERGPTVDAKAQPEYRGGMTNHDQRAGLILPRQFLRMCRRNLWRSKVADSSGLNLSGGGLLLQTLVLCRLLAREVLSPDENYVGVLLPPSVGAVLVNAALPLLRRVPVNVNYTLPTATLNACLAQVGARHVLTSRLFLTKTKLSIDAEPVFLEDLRERMTWRDKLLAAAATYAVPAWLLERYLGLHRVAADDLLTIVFTAGSTGDPKGVMLSHHNVGSNVEAVREMFRIEKTDVVLGILPFFHSFGYTGTLWTVLSLDPKGVYHFTPLDARMAGRLCHEHKVTILLSTPTFLRAYLRRCDKDQLRFLEVVVVSAEKMPLELAHAFREKFGVLPFEAYGSTELSPTASTNIPESRMRGTARTGLKEGTVGRPIPGSRAKVVDPDTGQERGIDQEGMLLITGPNVMLGYLNRPEKTAEVIRDGWYVTGDIARIDADGFITITDRASRFSKIGGEMVPHLKVEESLKKALSDVAAEEDEVRLAVTAVPDAEKGERLVVIHKPLGVTVETILEHLSTQGLPNLWIPSRDSFVEVPEIPVLGAGKVDLKSVKQMALARFGPKDGPQRG